MTASNPARNTRNIDIRQSVVAKLIKPAAKRRRARTNAGDENVQTTQARNIELFGSDGDENLVDDVGDDDSIDSFFLHPSSQIMSQATCRLFSTSTGPKQEQKLVSDIWKHFGLNANNDMKCNYCYAIYKHTGGTRAPRNHLTKEHGIDSANRQSAATAIYNENIEVALSRLSEEKQALKDGQFNIDMTKRINKQHLEYLYMKWTVMADVEFSQIFNKDFRTFLYYINQPANEMLSSAPNTIKTRVHLLFYESQRRLRQLFHFAISSVHITCDAWTSLKNLRLSRQCCTLHRRSRRFADYTTRSKGASR